jgi:hypothetical protein
LRYAAVLPKLSKNLSEDLLGRLGNGGTVAAMLLHTQPNADTIQTIVPETIVQIAENTGLLNAILF